MPYQGFLIKVGNFQIPLSFIKAESYQITRNIQDLDSYRDADGILHRTALEHFSDKVEFECVPMLTENSMENILSGIRNNYTIPLERKSSVTLFVPEINGYTTEEMYMADPTFSFYGIFNGKIVYNSVRFAFIRY